MASFPHVRVRRASHGTVNRLSRLLFALVLLVAVLPGGLVSGAAALADGGDYSLDFAAAAPFTYDHATGGGAFNDRTIGNTADVVESLEGGDFVCGDIVTYLTQIAVGDLSGGQNSHLVETIELDYRFRAEGTNGAAAGHVDVVGVSINYGSVVNGAGPGGTDSGINDDGGSTATIMAEAFDGGAIPDGSYPDPQVDYLNLSVKVDDLESFETVVLRIDVLLGCGMAGGTGNIQSKFDGADVVAGDGQPFADAIPGGAQTIPFMSFSADPEPPVIVVQKDNDADMDNVFTDTEAADPGVPVTVTYQVMITNQSTDPAVIDSVSDDIHDITGSTCAALIGIVIGAGETITCTFDVTFDDDDMTVVNIFTVTGSNSAGSSTDSDDSTVILPDLLPAIQIDKSASVGSVPETGGDVTFTVTVINQSAESVTLDALVDDVFGDLDGVGTCSVPQTLTANGGTYQCSFTETLSGEPATPHINEVTATASDDDGNEATDSDDETVAFDDLLPVISVDKTASLASVPETGGNVTFTVSVTNQSAESVTLDSLVDDAFGDLDGVGTCSVPQTLTANGGTYQCSFTEFLSGPANTTHTNVVTAVASDDDGNEATDSDDETVTFGDEIPAIAVAKTASVASVPETGGDVTFTVTVTNQSVESVTLSSLVDDVFGDLDGVGTCSVPQTLAAGGGTYQCTFNETLAGEPATPHVNVVTGAATDDDGNEATDSDDETVTFNDLLPTISVDKSGSVAVVAESGANVTFTVTVTNGSAESVTLNSLVDDVFGDFDGAGTCSVPQTLSAGGGTYQCSFTEFLVGDPQVPHVNVVTAIASDNDGNEATDSDDETVVFGDELPVITVDKTASEPSVPETGGDVTYTVTVTNVGVPGVTLDVITDDVFGDLDGRGTCAVPQTLSSGEHYECSFSELLSGVAGQPHVNLVTVTATDEDGDKATDSDDASVAFDPIIDLEVTKSAATSVVDEGATIEFTITVTNQGPSDATGVVLEDTPASELTYVSHSGDGSFDAGTWVWTIGALAVGETKTLVVTMTVEDAGLFLNEVEVIAATQTDADSVPGDGQGDDYAQATVQALLILASGAIGDTVFLDEDKDGVQDTGEPGIAGVTVRLENVSTGEIVTTTTNADGKYLFAALDVGQYVVTTVQPASDLALTTPASVTVDLGDGETFLDADFGYAGSLPQTGMEIETLARYGLLLLLAGVVLTAFTRRRKET